MPCGSEPLSDDEVLAVARSCLRRRRAARRGRRRARWPAATACRSSWRSCWPPPCDPVGTPSPTTCPARWRHRWPPGCDDLPPAARPLLTAAALLGRHFDWTLAAAAAGVAEDEAAELLRLAVRAQLVDVEGAGFRFRHALTRDAVVAASLPAEQARLAARALDALTAADPELDGERGPSPPSWPPSPAQPDRAADLWLRGRRARARGGLPRLRRDPGRAAPATPASTTTPAGRRARCCCGCARCPARPSGRARSACGCWRSDRSRRASRRPPRAGRRRLGAGRWDAAEEHATAARTLTSSDPARLARVDALAAEAAVGRNDLDAAVALAPPHSTAPGAPASSRWSARRSR